MHWVFVAALGLSLVVESGDYSLVAVHRLLVVLASLVGRAQALGTQASYLQLMGLVALQEVESSRIRDETRVPYVGRWILTHRTTKEVLLVSSDSQKL